MIISDGTTSIEIEDADENENTVIDQGTRKSAGGSLKQQISGERFSLDVRVRVSFTEARAIKDLITNNASRYYYTPEGNYDILYPDIEFPIEVIVSKFKRIWNNNNYQYFTFTVDGVDYI